MENKNNLSEHFFHFSDKTLQPSLRDCQDLFEKKTQTHWQCGSVAVWQFLHTDNITSSIQQPTRLNILITADCSDVLLFWGKYRDITDSRLYKGRNEIL